MRTVNTVIANIERIIKLSNKKQENMIYQYWIVGRELSRKNSVNKFGSDFIGNVVVKVDYTEGAPTLEELFSQKLTKMREQEEEEYRKWHPK